MQLIRHVPYSGQVLQTLRPTFFLEFNQKIDREKLFPFLKSALFIYAAQRLRACAIVPYTHILGLFPLTVFFEG
jgi:hypothetical protein